MKNVGKLILVLMMLCHTVKSQVSVQGSSASGITLEDVAAIDKSLGLVMAHKATQGIQFDITIATNVMVWNDITGNVDSNGNHYTFTQYNPTNQAAYCLFGTNILGNPVPAVYFETNAPYLGGGHMRCDNVAPQFSGVDKPFSWIIVVNGRTTANIAVCMGWSGSTNANASRMGFRPNRTGGIGAPTNEFFISGDTNQAAPTFGLGGAAPTNVWTIQAVTYDGATLTQFSRLTPTQASTISFGVNRTHDMCTIGGLRNQGTFTQRNRCALAEEWLYTNALTGTQITNKINEINGRLQLY